MNVASTYDVEEDLIRTHTPGARVAGKTRALAALTAGMALLVIVVGALVLLGWATGNERLTAVLEGHATMKPNTAIGFMLAGVALLLALRTDADRWIGARLRSVLHSIAAGGVLLIGLATLLEHLLHVSFGIDHLAFTDPVQARTPGRMAWITAANFLLAGMAFLLMEHGRMARRAARTLSALVMMSSFAGVVGYLYGVPLLFGGAETVGDVSMALHTGICFLLLSGGMLFAEHESKVLKLLSADGSGSRLARNLLPLMVVGPVVLGWFYLRVAERIGGVAFGMALLAVTLVTAGVVLVWVLAVFLNRAEHQRAELAAVRAASHATVRRSEQELRLVTDHLPVLLSYVDRQGRFLNVNQTYQQWHGRGTSEIVGHSIRELLGVTYWESTRVARETALAGETVAFEALYPTHGGERRVQVTYAPDRDEDGQVRGLACMVLDIEDQRKTESALRQSEKLAVVGRLASSIAHEINNPLESVTNLLYLSATELEGRQPLSEYMQLAQQELARVTQIVTQTLRFHRQSTHATRVSLADLLEQVLVLYQGRLTGAGIALERGFRDTSQVLCREGEIRQVLANLVGNAVDAMPRGGRLVLRTRCVRDEQSGREGVLLLVGDTGHGIPAAVRQKLYEPFQTTKGERGSGLGLWVSKDIVDRHGGSLRVRSRLNPGASGTVFRLWLPLARAGDEA